MLPHQLSQDLVLALDLFLQVLDAFLLGLMVGAGFGLESGVSGIGVFIEIKVCTPEASLKSIIK